MAENIKARIARKILRRLFANRIQIAQPWLSINRQWAHHLAAKAGCGGHLVWSSNVDFRPPLATDKTNFFGTVSTLIYLVAWILPVYFIPIMREASLAFVFGSLLLSILVAKRNEISSLWCFFAVAHLVIPFFVIGQHFV